MKKEMKSRVLCTAGSSDELRNCLSRSVLLRWVCCY